jgi:hypothetical protein
MTPGAALPAPSLFRLYTLRACYLVLVLGLGIYVWPVIIDHTSEVAMRSGIRFSLLGGLGLVALLGLRYPVQMIPLLIFELTWKTIYFIAFVWPLWRAHQMTDAVMEDVQACAVVIIFIPLIPWRYVWQRYIAQPGERWK